MSLKPSQDASVVVVRRGNEVLLVQRRDVPVWVLPGGGIDEGETPEQAAVREAKEESGIEVRIRRKVAEYSAYRSFTRLTHLFEAEPISGETTTSEESRAVAWFASDALPKHLLSIHRIWLEETLQDCSEVIMRPQTEVTIWRIISVFFSHPGSSLRYLLTRLFNRKD